MSLLDKANSIIINPDETTDMFVETGEYTCVTMLDDIESDVLSPTLSTRFITEG